ncbi:hypothetical protein ACIQGT_25515 [Streptomyces sp. NPDC093108]|uniref:hypothetical protein n=1 Tax=Streptomyces sp. NPDC093108 TaxID=3366030 RepID=UPI0038167268
MTTTVLTPLARTRMPPAAPSTTVRVFVSGGGRTRTEITALLAFMSPGSGVRLTSERTPHTVAVHVTGVVDDARQLALEQSRATTRGCRIILVVRHPSMYGIRAVTPHGVTAVVLLSEADPDPLADVVTTVAGGGHRIPPGLKRLILDTARHTQCPCLHRVRMSPAEIGIVRLVSHGATTRAIARSTARSLESVKRTPHYEESRLGTRSRTHRRQRHSPQHHLTDKKHLPRVPPRAVASHVRTATAALRPFCPQSVLPRTPQLEIHALL